MDKEIAIDNVKFPAKSHKVVNYQVRTQIQIVSFQSLPSWSLKLAKHVAQKPAHSKLLINDTEC